MDSVTPPVRARRRRGGRAPDTHRRPRGGQRSGPALTINPERTVTLRVAVRLSPAAYGRPTGRIGATPPASWELSARAEEMAFDLQH